MADKKNLKQPIVAVMGHVDHGKTTFLDNIRGANVAAREKGGITQNTRLHEVTTKSGFKITFIDTPGHEAFGNMRLRGAQVTDFVLLIVAADDGIQPQTKQSIKFAKENNVPIIVAINKVDISGINTQKIKKSLADHDVLIEEYGGDVLFFEISAKNKVGLDGVLEGIELLTEVNELKSKPQKEGTLGEAFVVESNLDKQLGNVALCILKAGNLNSNKIFAAYPGNTFKVRAFLDENQKTIDKVHESSPFWITGLKNDPKAGEIIYFAETENQAEVIQKELDAKQESGTQTEALDTDSLFAQLLVQRQEKKEGIEQKQLNLIVRASSQGTLEAVISQLEELNTDESKVHILASGTGEVSEDDIARAKLARAIVVSFQTKLSGKIETAARTEKVIVRNYEIIYELVDQIADVLDSLEEPKEVEVEIANAKVKQVFTLTNGSVVAGSEVIKGVMLKGYRVKVVRGGKEIYKGRISNLRQGKNEVKEVKKGLDCGIQLDPKPTDIEEGDEVVAYKVEQQ